MVDKVTDTNQNLLDIANILRIESIKMTDASKSGHPTSCCSVAEILACLFFDPSGLHFIPTEPRNPANDVLVLSKGHACPAYYAAWSYAGNFPKEELLNLRKMTSDLEGHPTPRLDFCDFATGSLGQGLSNTVGCAYSSKHMDGNNNKYFCVMGDGECAEGSVWEAAHFAGLYKLDNVIAVLDCNRLGQSDKTSIEHDMNLYNTRFTNFGFKVFEIDGHNPSEIVNALQQARLVTGQPSLLLCKTYKGKGLPGIEDLVGFHGKPILN